MWIDSTLEFCSATAVPTGGAATTLIGDVVDLGTPNRDIGQGHPMYLVIQVTTAIAGGTAVQFVLASDSVEAITADGNESRHYTSDVFLVAELTAGFGLVAALPMGDTKQGEDAAGYERFLGIEIIGTGTQSSGNINAFLTNDPHGWLSYPDGTN